MKSSFLTGIAVSSLALFLAAPAQAQDDVSAMVEKLARISSSYGGAEIEGGEIVFLSRNGGSPQIWAMPADRSAAPNQVTDLEDPVSSMSVSPDGKWIAYASAPGGGLNEQIFIMPASGGDAKRLTAGGRSNNRLSGWTRSGSHIRAMMANGSGGMDAVLIDPSTGEATMLATGGMNYSAKGSADGRYIGIGKLKQRGSSAAYLLDRTTGKLSPVAVSDDIAQTVAAEITPDGQHFYLITNLDSDDFYLARGSIGEDGSVSALERLRERDDAQASGFSLNDDASRMVLVWDVAGRHELELIDLGTGDTLPTPPLPFDSIFVSDSLTDGRWIMDANAIDRPADVYLASADFTRIVRMSDSDRAGIDMSQFRPPELIRYEAQDGLELSGWLYRAPGEGPGPLVLNFHGGPEGQARPSARSDFQALLAKGISVFDANVRGSAGFGKEFVNLDNGALRHDGVRDIEATARAMVERGIADPDRLGIMGGSYGGYMVMAGVTEFPDLFAAGANLFGIVNFATFFEQTEPWMAAISKVEYGDPDTEAEMLAALSPIHKLDRVKTPLIVLHGANDTNVPVVEAEQVVDTLRARDVSVEYVLFEDEGHGWRKTENRVTSTVRIVDFFDRHLNGAID